MLMGAYVWPQELTAEAADYGITWGLEVVNRYESNVLNTASKVCLCCPAAPKGSRQKWGLC